MTPPPAPSCAKSGPKGPIVLGKMGQHRGVVQNLHLVAANENAVCQKKTSSELMAFPRKRILLDFFTALSLVWWWKAFGLFFFSLVSSPVRLVKLFKWSKFKLMDQLEALPSFDGNGFGRKFRLQEKILNKTLKIKRYKLHSSGNPGTGRHCKMKNEINSSVLSQLKHFWIHYV